MFFVHFSLAKNNSTCNERRSLSEHRYSSWNGNAIEHDRYSNAGHDSRPQRASMMDVLFVERLLLLSLLLSALFRVKSNLWWIFYAAPKSVTGVRALWCLCRTSSRGKSIYCRGRLDFFQWIRPVAGTWSTMVGDSNLTKGVKMCWKETFWSSFVRKLSFSRKFSWKIYRVYLNFADPRRDRKEGEFFAFV